MKEQIEKIMSKKMTRRNFLALLGASILAILLMPKFASAKVFLRKMNGSTIDVDNLEENVIVAGTVTRTSGLISEIALGNGITWTITRDANNLIQTLDNGTQTVTITRDAANKIDSWSVA